MAAPSSASLSARVGSNHQPSLVRVHQRLEDPNFQGMSDPDPASLVLEGDHLEAWRLKSCRRAAAEAYRARITIELPSRFQMMSRGS